jgi:proteasome lid subunit RPN8/RPN11
MAEGTAMSTLRCATPLVDDTLKELRAAGRRGKERVVLWLSPRPLVAGPAVAEVYVPEQEAEVDYFRIPPSGMKALMTLLRERKLALAAQVHSHPKKAFHSHADDEWAIVRHEGALSIVVPHFAADTDVENFLSSAAIFRLTSADKWVEVEREAIGEFLQLT